MTDFLIIGGGQAASQRDIFQLIKDGKIWFGVKKWSENVYFIPGSYSDDMMTKRSYKEFDGEVMTTINICVWWTNIEHNMHSKLVCTEIYEEGKYERYDNFDAINVDDVREIPLDYMGLMGVPVTYLEKWDKDEFELVGLCNCGSGGLDKFRPIVEGKEKYCRILIKRK